MIRTTILSLILLVTTSITTTYAELTGNEEPVCINGKQLSNDVEKLKKKLKKQKNYKEEKGEIWYSENKLSELEDVRKPLCRLYISYQSGLKKFDNCTGFNCPLAICFYETEKEIFLLGHGIFGITNKLINHLCSDH